MYLDQSCKNAFGETADTKRPFNSWCKSKAKNHWLKLPFRNTALQNSCPNFASNYLVHEYIQELNA